jgi:hypothetical protein
LLRICGRVGAFFGVWWLLTSRLRYWSLRQDVTGDALCVHKMRFHSGWGILAFAATLTGACVLWMKSLQYQWFSAMYGVYFFSDCIWIALATVYVITVILQRQRILDGVLHDNQFYFLGVWFFAFTLFRPTPSSRNTSSSGTRTCPRKPSGISSANTARGGG